MVLNDELLRRVVKFLIPRRLFRVIEPYGHWGEAVLANWRYGFPARGLKVIGVTGTDGKTTTAMLIATMLKEAGLKVGLMTTVLIDLGDGPTPNPTRLTNIKSFPTFRRFRQMRRAGLDWVVFEVTSHALAEHRADGIPYSVGVLTNVTHEHLDYHRTFERYRDAKLRLFKLVARNRQGLQAGIINADDPSGKVFAAPLPKVIRYGLKQGDLRAEEVESDASGSRFTAVAGERRLRIRTQLPGGFNVSNALAAVGVGLAVGLSDTQIEQGIAALREVPGRMNRIEAGQDFAVIVDYAHTPGSFTKILPQMRELTKGRLIVVFGSAGRRDEAKRPILGELVGKLADVAILTEEDDRDQDGAAILEQIAAGAERAGKVRERDLFLVHERRAAIERAIGLAAPGDTVLLLGKGHESSMLTNAGKVDWDEAAVARGAIKSRK